MRLHKASDNQIFNELRRRYPTMVFAGVSGSDQSTIFANGCDATRQMILYPCLMSAIKSDSDRITLMREVAGKTT